jgi:hypothetical protein
MIRREERGVGGKGVAMHKRPDLRIIPGGVSAQADPKRPVAAADATEEALWAAYVAASERSKETLSFADGLIAGQAYARFVESFVQPSRGRA